MSCLTTEDHLTITPGKETDSDQIESDIVELCRRFRVVNVGFDPWQSTQMAQRLRIEEVNILEFRATTQNFSPAIIEVDAADRRGNLYPAKQRPEQKTDAAVALMMAVGRAMAEDGGQGDIMAFLRNPVIA
jgi:phage terminase large subunit-like protein